MSASTAILTTGLATLDQRDEADKIIDALPAYIWFKDTENRILRINQAAAKATGLRREEIEGRLTEEVYPDQANDYYEGDKQVIATGEAITEIIEPLQGEAGIRWMSIDKLPVKDGEGSVTGVIVVATDITDQRAKEEELLSMGRLIEDSLNEVFIFSRDDYRFLYANRGARENTGYSLDQLEKITPLDIKPEHTAESFQALVEPLVDGTQTTVAFETRHQRADGTTYTADIRVQLSHFQGIEAFTAFIADVTEQREKEAELLATGRLLEDSLNEVYIYTRDDLHFLYANRGARENLGYTLDEMEGMTPLDVAPHFNTDKFKELVAPLHKGEKESITFESEHLRKDSSRYPVDVRLQLSQFRGVDSYSVFIVDVTEQKWLREQLQLAVIGGDIGLWDWNVKDNTVYFSAELHQQLGEEPGAMSGFDDWESRCHPDDLGPAKQRVADHFAGKYPDNDYEQTFRLRHRDGNYRWFLSRAQLIRDAQGEPERMIGTHVDVTANRELIDKLTAANRDLDSFAYAASHDLKAPMRAIDNLSQWLVEDLGDIDLPEKSRDHLATLRTRAQRMEMLLDDLLKYSRIGREEFEAESIDTGELVNEAFSLVAPAGGFQLETKNLPQLHTIRPPLELCLRNLIDNAIKHHDRNDGIITVAAVDQDEFYEFRVIDDGPGIAPEFHEQIFGMFRSLKPRDVVEGSGIGLAMLKKTIEHYGGTFHVESSVGKGSTFAFTWPK